MSDKDLAENIDQLMSKIPQDNRGEPTCKALELAWWHAENSHREFHNDKCSACKGKSNVDFLYCGTCERFRKLTSRARMAQLCPR